MMHKLTPEAEEFLNELSEALKMECSNKHYHPYLENCIIEFRHHDSVIRDYAETCLKMMEILGRLSDRRTAGNEDAANTFKDLNQKLFDLIREMKFIRT